MNENIPFNRPVPTGKELENLAEVMSNGKLSGDGIYTKMCHNWLEENSFCHKALLTHSCTAALEMCALLLDIMPGDEIIMPSYTFVSTANAFVLRGGIPVFVDIREDTLNLDECLVEAAITPRTKAIVPVHYAGVGCEMDTINRVAKKYDLKVVEDAAQGVMASYKGRPLGSIGDLGAYSFHETKNIISGEGGALLVRDKSLAQDAEILREKGTNRTSFLRGDIDKYTWQGTGSSYLPSELIAAFLFAQLEQADVITDGRLKIWNNYHELIAPLEWNGLLRRPVVPIHCGHNGHMYYILLAPEVDRSKVIAGLRQNGITAVSHYEPLHSSPAGKRYCQTHGELKFTTRHAASLLRLPLWIGLSEIQQERIVETLKSLIN